VPVSAAIPSRLRWNRHGPTWADIAVVPVDDLSPNQVAVAWPTGHDTALIREFVEAARTLLPDNV
jgi:hypothetical protein